MKIAFIFGKGIDGCGVTRGALIYEKWLRDAGHTSLIIDFDNGQQFGRAQDANWIGDVYKIHKKDIDVKNEITNKVNNCDIAIFHSHPTRKQTPYVDRYRRFLEKIEQPIIVIHDHSIAKTNINAIPQACEIFSKADVAVIQSLNGFSNTAYTNFDKGLKNRLIENPIWVTLKNYDKYNKPFIKRNKHLLYLGRMAGLKDPALICRIVPYISKEWQLSIIGCEASIAAVNNTDDLSINTSPYIPAFRKNIYQHTLNKKGEYNLSEKEKTKNARINSYDRYTYDWGMQQLGSSFASWCGYNLSDIKEYGTRMEYTMIESFLLSLPVVHPHFIENAYSPEGKLWKEYNGPLISQATKEKELAEELDRLSNNANEWNERTTACRELIFKFNNIDNIGQQYFDKIIAHGKRKNKINAINTISNYFPKAQKLRNNGKIVMSTASGTLNKIPMILENNKQVIYKDTSIFEDLFT